jgi:dihydrofolate synthase/folylpolyglutamate synthase
MLSAPIEVDTTGHSFKYDIKSNIQTILDPEGNELYDISLPGEHQVENSLLAFKASGLLTNDDFVITLRHILNGINKTVWPARCQYINDKNIILDGAHNPDGAMQLRKFLDNSFSSRNKIFIISILRTKDYKNMINNLVRENDTVIFTQMASNKALDSSMLYDYTLRKGISTNLHITGSVDEALILANNLQNNDSLIIITGSLYLMGDYLKLSNNV